MFWPVRLLRLKRRLREVIQGMAQGTVFMVNVQVALFNRGIKDDTFVSQWPVPLKNTFYRLNPWAVPRKTSRQSHRSTCNWWWWNKNHKCVCSKWQKQAPAEGCYPAAELQVTVQTDAIAAHEQLHSVIPMSARLVPAAGTGQRGVQLQNVIIQQV